MCFPFIPTLSFRQGLGRKAVRTPIGMVHSEVCYDLFGLGMTKLRPA